MIIERYGQVHNHHDRLLSLLYQRRHIGGCIECTMLELTPQSPTAPSLSNLRIT